MYEPPYAIPSPLQKVTTRLLSCVFEGHAIREQGTHSREALDPDAARLALAEKVSELMGEGKTPAGVNVAVLAVAALIAPIQGGLPEYRKFLERLDEVAAVVASRDGLQPVERYRASRRYYDSVLRLNGLFECLEDVAKNSHDLTSETLALIREVLDGLALSDGEEAFARRVRKLSEEPSSRKVGGPGRTAARKRTPSSPGVEVYVDEGDRAGDGKYVRVGLRQGDACAVAKITRRELAYLERRGGGEKIRDREKGAAKPLRNTLAAWSSRLFPSTRRVTFAPPQPIPTAKFDRSFASAERLGSPGKRK